MIASAIAGRDALCCGSAIRNRITIADNVGQIMALKEMAQERLGCWVDAPQERWDRYLEVVLQWLGC